MQSLTACIPADIGELALLTPRAVSKVVALANFCTSLRVSPLGRSTSVGGCCGSLPTVGSVGGGAKAGGDWCSKGPAGGASDQQVLLKGIPAEQWIPSSSLAEELVIANGYMYGVGLEEVGHQCLVLYQFQATGRCMMCGDDKKAVPCLHPGLKVSDFPGRGALLVTLLATGGWAAWTGTISSTAGNR